MIKAVRHTGIVVQDLNGALDFWINVMGFRLEKQQDENTAFIDTVLGIEGSKLTTAKLAAPDGNLIELLCFSSHPDKPRWKGRPTTTGLTHIAFTVANLDSLCERLRENGCILLSQPQISADGHVKIVFVGAQESLLLELVEVIS